MVNLNEEKLQYILSALNKIEYGSLLITIHEGEITQLDTTIKNRFTKPKSAQFDRKIKN